MCFISLNEEKSRRWTTGVYPFNGCVILLLFHCEMTMFSCRFSNFNLDCSSDSDISARS